MPSSGSSSRPTVLITGITGAARCVARAVALDLGRAGWQVCVHGSRSVEEALQLAADIRSFGAPAVAVADDPGSPVDAARIVAQCRETLGAPVCLVNATCEAHADSVATLTGESWAANFDIHLKVPVFLARAMFLDLPEGEIGNVISIIDRRVRGQRSEFLSYTLAQDGLWAATQALAVALAPRVRVNAIALSPDGTGAATWAPADDAVPMPGAIAEAVRFILEAPSLTGQLIALGRGEG